MRGVRLELAVALLLGLVAAIPEAQALTVTRAKIMRGAIQVRGRDAAPGATITWESVAVGQASSTGRFRFETTALPEDCVGEVSDGADAALAVVTDCGPVGPAGSSLRVVDAVGVSVGTVVDLLGPSDAAVTMRVARRLGDQVVFFDLSTDGFVATASGHAWYESSDL